MLFEPISVNTRLLEILQTKGRTKMSSHQIYDAVLYVSNVLLTAASLATVGILSKPEFTIFIHLPLCFYVGRFGGSLISTTSALSILISLLGLTTVAVFRNKQMRKDFKAKMPKSSPAANFLQDEGESESAEWLNEAVRYVWRRYPTQIAKLLQENVLQEILNGCKRDKLLPTPGNLIKDIVPTAISLKDAAPWIMGVKLHRLRSQNEVWLSGTVRFVSDEGAEVVLKIVTLLGDIPVSVDNISVEAKVLLRVHLLDDFPFVRVIWISLIEEPKLDLSIRSLAKLDFMAVPGLDLLLHELIMTAIRNEVMWPMGKTAPVFMANPELEKLHKNDESFYKEEGAIQTSLNTSSGMLTVFLLESKAMLHPDSVNLSKDTVYQVYISVEFSGKVFRTARIKNPSTEIMNERFEFPFPGDSVESVNFELVLEQSNSPPKKVMIASIPLQSILQHEWDQEKWAPGPNESYDMINAKMKLRFSSCIFQEPCATVSLQRSPSNEIVGGKAEPHTLSGKGKAASTNTISADLDRCWRDIVPLKQIKAIVWVTVLLAKDLKKKMLQTRDPYVRVGINSYEQKTTAKTNTVEPVWNECFGLPVYDPVNDKLEITVFQNDWAQGRSLKDDDIGSCIVPLSSLFDPSESEETGLKQKRRLGAGLGLIHLAFQYNEIPDAIAEAKKCRAHSKKCLYGFGLPIHVPRQAGSGRLDMFGVLQVRILEGNLCPEDDRHPTTSVALQLLGKEQQKSGSKVETRSVRDSKQPRWMEYTEFCVSDADNEWLEISIMSTTTAENSKWGLLKRDCIGTNRLSVLDIARGNARDLNLRFPQQSTIRIDCRLALLGHSKETSASSLQAHAATAAPATAADGGGAAPPPPATEAEETDAAQYPIEPLGKGIEVFNTVRAEKEKEALRKVVETAAGSAEGGETGVAEAHVAGEAGKDKDV